MGCSSNRKCSPSRVGHLRGRRIEACRVAWICCGHGRSDAPRRRSCIRAPWGDSAWLAHLRFDRNRLSSWRCWLRVAAPHIPRIVLEDSLLRSGLRDRCDSAWRRIETRRSRVYPSLEFAGFNGSSDLRIVSIQFAKPITSRNDGIRMHREFLTVRLSPDDVRMIEELRRASGSSKLELVKRAIRILARSIDAETSGLYSLGAERFGRYGSVRRQSADIKSFVKSRHGVAA
jgi:hypothetical protein